MAKNLTDIRSLARGHTEGALATLASIMHSEEAPPAARVAAANSLLDRGWGKPAQPLTGDEDGPPIRFTRIELIGVRPPDQDS